MSKADAEDAQEAQEFDQVWKVDRQDFIFRSQAFVVEPLERPDQAQDEADREQEMKQHSEV